MPRVKATLTINFNFHSLGKKVKLEVCRSAWDRRFIVRLDRKNSTKFETETITGIAKRIAALLKMIR